MRLASNVREWAELVTLPATIPFYIAYVYLFGITGKRCDCGKPADWILGEKFFCDEHLPPAVSATGVGRRGK